MFGTCKEIKIWLKLSSLCMLWLYLFSYFLLKRMLLVSYFFILFKYLFLLYSQYTIFYLIFVILFYPFLLQHMLLDVKPMMIVQKVNWKCLHGSALNTDVICLRCMRKIHESTCTSCTEEWVIKQQKGLCNESYARIFHSFHWVIVLTPNICILKLFSFS